MSWNSSNLLARTKRPARKLNINNRQRSDLVSSRLDQSEQADGATPSITRPQLTDSPCWAGPLVFLLALAPALAAIWVTPSFTTQDGPAHLYNAQIINSSFEHPPPFQEIYTVRWRPIPNWAGPFTLSAIVAVLPAWAADRIMTSLTLVAFGASILWLRWCVAGRRGMRVAALLAALLAMNIAWLFGFTSFLLGACLFPITLAVWWQSRERLNTRSIVALSALLTLGYFCHLVSLGLTALGLVVLASAGPLPVGPGTYWQRRSSCLARTSASFLPLIALGVYYLGLARQGGPMRPQWHPLMDPWSVANWTHRLGWVDPLTLATKNGLPLTERLNRWFFVFAPAVWAVAAWLLWIFARIAQWHARTRAATPTDASESVAQLVQRLDQPRSGSAGPPASRQGWMTLGAILLLVGFLGPDALGPAHGDYLPQRVILLGLVALVPIFDLRLSGWVGPLSLASLLAAVAFQSTIVWDYALYCDRSAGQFIRARDAVGRNQRVVVVLVKSRGRFRANPLLHAENWLGVDTRNVVWNNYETLHYYFPVQFQPGIDRPHPDELELVSLHENSEQASERARDWERIL
ncbi:MAG TPA: hypothetical protein VKA15_03185, partial [Isosphaeraceae bacterium]|nr:hypothetical protein [Isosphaeraceae bacterium]